MKRYLVLFVIVSLAVVAAQAQVLNVKVGSVTYVHRAANAGDMPFTQGTTLTIEGKAYQVGDTSAADAVSQISLSDDDVVDNTVSVSYSGTSASVVVAGNVAQYLTVSVTGAHVSIVQADDLPSEITYTLSGTSTDGEFYMDGSLKASLELDGLSLTNPSGPAINIQNGKRINLSVKKDTENTLRDGSGGDWKGCLRCKGHLELKGKGVLNVYGNTAHAVWSKEYVEMKNCTINILKAVGDGLNCNQYFLMESGTLSISGVGDDGIQVSYKTDDDGTVESDEENTGALTVSGGTLSVTTTAAGAKGLKAEGAVLVNENTATTVITVKNSGGVDATDSSDPTSSACLKSDKAITIDGGTLTLTNTGQGGRAINSEGTLAINGGTISAQAQGSNYGSSSSGGGGGWGAWRWRSSWWRRWRQLLVERQECQGCEGQRRYHHHGRTAHRRLFQSRRAGVEVGHQHQWRPGLRESQRRRHQQCGQHDHLRRHRLWLVNRQRRPRQQWQHVDHRRCGLGLWQHQRRSRVGHRHRRAA